MSPQSPDRLPLVIATTVLANIATIIYGYQNINASASQIRHSVASSNYVQVQGILRADQGFLLEHILPLWIEWQSLYHASQRFATMEPKEQDEFLSRVYLAEDRWNIVVLALSGERTNQIDISGQLYALVQDGRSKDLPAVINSTAGSCRAAIQSFSARVEAAFADVEAAQLAYQRLLEE